MTKNQFLNIELEVFLLALPFLDLYEVSGNEGKSVYHFIQIATTNHMLVRHFGPD